MQIKKGSSSYLIITQLFFKRCFTISDRKRWHCVTVMGNIMNVFTIIPIIPLDMSLSSITTFEALKL